MDRREILKKLKDDGWYQVGTTGSHDHFKASIIVSIKRCQVLG